MEITQTLLELLKIPSFTGEEQQIAESIHEWVFDETVFEFSEFGLTRIYRTFPVPEKPTVALYGHMDTVIDQQDSPPFFDSEYVYGCGASDMKGGLAVMIELMKNLNPEHLKYNLQFIFYDREEGPYEENGLYFTLPRAKVLKAADFALVLEPTNNQIQAGCVGVINQKIKIHGKSAHSARPWEGKNALHKSWNILKKLDETLPIEHKLNGLNFFEVCNATLSEGGKQRNALPGEFSMNLNYRFPPGWSGEKAMATLREKFSEESPEFLDYEISPSGEVCTDHPILKKMIENFGLKIEAKQAWTDIAQLTEHGISAVNFGPGNPAEAHQANEKIPIKNLVRSHEIFQSFLCEEEKFS